MSNFPGKGVVAVVKTSPETILQDIESVMKLAGVQQALKPEIQTGLKINASWQTWYPACSTAPWQLEGRDQRPEQFRLYESRWRPQ